MSETKIEPLKAEKAPIYDAINSDVAKGVLIDGFGIGMSDNIAIIDGFVGQPRFKNSTLVCRILLPIEALKELQEGIDTALKDYEEMCKKADKKDK
jgi:hypothetical protein